ncbi:50S ribosomal protein L10 [Candidatus Woesearchaeota archaeon]|nr:50S ribosomal protein L10 [Candidatus Woesearchaeota archaeon]
MMQAHVAEYKKEVVSNLVELARKYPIIGVVNMESMPAPQLQNMRAQLRKNAVLTMTKRRIIKIAFQQAAKEKKGLESLNEHLGGMPALIFTNENPFRLSRTLDKSKSPAPAKAGQIAPNDITIHKGPTPFAPGPFIAELSMTGIKSGIEGGKIAIKEDTVVAKKGDKIKPKVAEILLRLGIQPMEVGLGLVAVYEKGLIYTRDILSIDDAEYMKRIGNASRWAFNLAMNSHYPTKSTIKYMIGNAHKDATALGVSRNIFDKGIIELLIGKAHRQLHGLKNAANLQVDETFKPVEQEKKSHEAHKHEEHKEHSGVHAPSMKELEENIKKRDKEKEVRDVEQIAKDIVKKHASEHK